MDKIKFIFFFFFLQNSISAQTIDLNDFVVDSLQLDKKIYPSGNIRKSWQLYESNEIIKAKQIKQGQSQGDSLPYSKDYLSQKFDKTAGKRIVKKVTNGYLIAYNHGEFRCGFYYLSFDGNEYYDIAPANFKIEDIYTSNYRGSLRINDIFEFNSKIYAIEGMSHLGSEYGSLNEIYLENNKWKYKQIQNTYETPYKVVPKGNDILIITSNHILKLNSELRLLTFMKSPFRWGAFYPNSAIIIKKDFYIGMNGGILKIENFEKKPRYIWYNHK